MKLSIIIVNWNSTEFLKQCVQSIVDTTRDLEFEVIVVDNASTDQSFHELANRFPGVKLICSPQNVGFACANNLGEEHATGANLLFLNPDTLVRGNAIRTMLLVLQSSTELGAVGCRLLNGDGTLQTSCVQPFPNILNQVLAIDWVQRRLPQLAFWGKGPLYAKGHASVAEVDVVSGACLMVKRDTFEHVGRFSDEYFMYAEEIDLCYKIRLAGLGIGYTGQAEVVHFGGQSTKKHGDGFSDMLMRDSIFKFLRKFRGLAYAWSYRLSLLASASLRVLLLGLLLVMPPSMFDRDAVRFAFRKWCRIATWALSLDRWVTLGQARPPAPANVKQA